MTSAFDTETAVHTAGDGRWTTKLSSAWNINLNPNGGYAQTALLRAMASEAGDHQDPVSATTHFLRPALGDAAGEITVEVIRRGRMLTTVRGVMSQEGKERLTAMATFCDLGSMDNSQEFQLDPVAPDLPPPEQCVGRSPVAQGVELPLLSRVEVRMDPATLPSEQVAQTETPPSVGRRATVSGWMRFADGREPDSLALPLLADCFPPSVFNAFGRIGWVPTVELTVHVRRRPGPGWIKAHFTTEDSFGGLLVEDGAMWDSSGALVARSRQLAMVR